MYLCDSRPENKIFGVKNFFHDFGFRLGVRLNLRTIRKNHSADLEIGFVTKIDSKAVWPSNGYADSVGVKSFNQ